MLRLAENDCLSLNPEKAISLDISLPVLALSAFFSRGPPSRAIDFSQQSWSEEARLLNKTVAALTTQTFAIARVCLCTSSTGTKRHQLL